MRVAIVCFVVMLAGCVSEETRQLAQGIHLYQAKQALVVEKLAEYARDNGAIEESEYDKVVNGQRALVTSTKSLSEILGKPEVDVEVGSW